MSNRIFLDFDGTLIDSSRRLYTLFSELAPESRLSHEEYWRIKRSRVTQRDLLRGHFGYTDKQIRSFKALWMEKVEEFERLATDTPFAGVDGFLKKLSPLKQLYLVTARQYPERVRAQLYALGWSGYFADILVTRQQQSKAALIRESVSYDSEDILAGDTGEDILAGKELGIQTVAVSSGVLNEDILREYNPDRLLDSVVKLGAG